MAWKKVVTESATDTIAQDTAGNAATVTNGVYTNRISSSGLGWVLDEDNMATDSATKVPTQQSVKAYVDTQVNTVDTLAEILANGNRTSTDGKIEFRDDAIHISSSADGQLDLVADTEIQIAATTIDIDGAIIASGEIKGVSLDISGDVDVDGTLETDAFSIGSTAVTATAAELNILDDVTATSTELNYLDITTLGKSEASKVVTADASGHVIIQDGAYDFDVASHDGTNGLKLGGTLVTASATELNYVKDVTSAIQTQLDAKGVGSITSVTLTTDSGALSAGSDAAGAVPVSILGGTGIVTSNSGMASTVTLNLNELTTSTADGDGDFFAVVDASGADKKLTKGNIALSGFNNDSSWADDQTAAEMATLFAADTGAVTFGGAVTVTGNLTVSGTTTYVNTATLEVEDQLIKLANVTSPDADSADGAGIQIEASATEDDFPELKWIKAQGGGNTDGTGTANGLTGWQVSNMHTSNQVDVPIAVMEFSDDSTAPTDSKAGGIGSFHYDSGDASLYIRTS